MVINVSFQLCTRGDLGFSQGRNTWSNQYGTGWEWEGTLKWFLLNITLNYSCVSHETESGE